MQRKHQNKRIDMFFVCMFLFLMNTWNRKPTITKRVRLVRAGTRGGGGGVLNRNLGRGVRATQRNPDPVQDAKDVNFATLSKRKSVISYPVQDWTKQAVFKTLKMVHRFAFSRILTKAHEISENYANKGGEKEKICGEDPV